MARTFTIWLFSFLVGCGQDTQVTVPSLQVYVDEYQAFADREALDTREFWRTVTVTYGDLPEGIIGTCFYGAEPLRIHRVIIRPRMSPTATRAVVFHELTHCHYGMEHIDDRLHLMNTYTASDEELEDAWDYLTESLADSIRNGEAPIE